MGNSYRIRTTPGDDKNINIKIDQDFEQLEILSLKIRQQDVYQRMCSDYGVIAGRVFANKGYGIPNVKISIFIPILPEDEENPVINAIYPYKNLEDTNEDGYKYNLLPYNSQYPGHAATGTFPNRVDVLTNDTVVEIYDKYYKYTVTTNDSGDFLIFGVPVGDQILVMNLDLSDMGPFSLSPQDLIRMGIATEGQLDGVEFKASTNLSELPQIVVINKTIEVVPFWGEEDTCQIGITRSDFDLTAEKNIELQPTAIFMGSLMSSNEKSSVKTSGKTQKETGDLCRLITGPGEIIALTQTIFRDENGLPIIEKAKLPNGGRLIDGEGTWLFDLPMNLDYVYTNEFGNQILSDDPSIGVPTKSKYRFKLKWQQTKSITEDYKRGYFLVPNIREKGWTNSSVDPIYSPGSPQYKAVQASYAFSLDWSSYTSSSQVNIQNRDILDAINCVDTFYEFDYNKVYTVAGLIDNFKISKNKERFLGIKRIDDETCEDDVNRYPVDDAVFRTTLIWRIFNLLMVIIGFILYPIVIVYSILAFVWNTLFIDFIGILSKLLIGGGIVLGILAILAIAGVITYYLGIQFGILAGIFLAAGLALNALYNSKLKKWKFGPLKLPMITYPDCDACFCGDGDGEGSSSTNTVTVVNPQESPGFFTPFNSATPYSKLFERNPDGSYYFNTDIFGRGLINFNDDAISVLNLLTGPTFTGDTGYGGGVTIQDNSKGRQLWTFDLNFGERINKFNLKEKYYNQRNQVSIKIEPTLNPGKSHTDQPLVFIIQPSNNGVLTNGDMFTLIKPESSADVNVTNSITGITGSPNSIEIIYAPEFGNRTATNSQTIYTLPTKIPDSNLYNYPLDIEYYQVLKIMTVKDFRTTGLYNGTETYFKESFAGLIESETTIFKGDYIICNNWGNGQFCPQYGYGIASGPYFKSIKPIDLIDQKSLIVIAQRGVDPYSMKYEQEIGLGKLLGKNLSGWTITGKYRINNPIRNTTDGAGNELSVIHSSIPNNASTNNGFSLFYESKFFTPGADFNQFSSNLISYYSAMDSSLTYTMQNSNPQIINIPNYQQSIPNNSGTLDLISKPANKNIFSSWVNRGVLYGAYYSQPTVVMNSYNLPRLPLPSPHAFYKSNESMVGGSMVYNPDLNSSIYFSKKYNSTTSTQISDKKYNVMRTDRLPSGDKFESFSFKDMTKLFQQNETMSYYLFKGGGGQSPPQPVIPGSTTTTTTEDPNTSYEYTGTAPSPQYNDEGIIDDSEYTATLDSFTCEDMVGIRCYKGQGLSFQIDSDCDGTAVQQGCYYFVRTPLFDLFGDKDKYRNDIRNLNEYLYRFRFFYALCQGVISQVFINNWVNGNLWAFPFKVVTIWNKKNQVKKRKYPKQLVILHDETNNFYYRCTPYETSSNRFIGYKPPDTYGGSNVLNLKYPTTITNLGPVDDFLKYVNLNNNFDGYNMKNLNSTSYQDLSEMVNFFSILRIIDFNFWTGLGGNQITRLFSRGGKQGRRIDGDFAQSAAINSQLGVINFDSSAYYTEGQNGYIPPAIAAIGYSNNTNSNNVMMGIFFQQSLDDIQNRDWISPVRNIRRAGNPTKYNYCYVPVKSQVVPHYKWKIEYAGAQTIFGTQINDWATDYTSIQQNTKYQELDRRFNPYPRGTNYNGTPFEDLMKGYLYQQDSYQYVTSPHTLQVGILYTIVDYVPGDDFSNCLPAAVSTNIFSPENAVGYMFILTASTTPISWNGSVLQEGGQYLAYLPGQGVPAGQQFNPNPALVGAPWYFYFGLKKGSSALNKFTTKYIGETELNG